MKGARQLNKTGVTRSREYSKGESRCAQTDTRGRDANTHKRDPQSSRYSQYRRTGHHGVVRLSLEC